MPDDCMFTDAEALLVTCNAQNLEHPGGTLLEHLRRVGGQLADWGASRDVQLAGLCHAAYGTDGFPVSLLDLDQRGTLREAIGMQAEELVYLYASCDRGQVYPQLDQAPSTSTTASPGCRPGPTGSPFGRLSKSLPPTSWTLCATALPSPLSTDQPSNGCSFALPGTSRHRHSRRGASGRRPPGWCELVPVRDPLTLHTSV